MTTPKKGIFISHIHEEANLGAVVKEWLTDSLRGSVTAFLSSDKQDLVAGEKWLDKIGRELADAGAVVSLLSPQSIARPWVNIELGAAWITGLPIIPLCHSGLAPSSLPRPFGDFTALSLDADDTARRLIDGVTSALGLDGYSQKIRFTDFLTEMRIAADQSKRVAVAPAPIAAGPALVAGHVAILQSLARAEDSGIKEMEEANAIRVSALSPTSFKYYADQLSEAKLIYIGYDMYGSHYHITPAGVGWLIKNSPSAG